MIEIEHLLHWLWRYRSHIYMICARSIYNLNVFKIINLEKTDAYIKENLRSFKYFIKLTDGIDPIKSDTQKQNTGSYIEYAKHIFDNIIRFTVTKYQFAFIPAYVAQTIRSHLVLTNLYFTCLWIAARYTMKLLIIRPDITINLEEECKECLKSMFRDYSDIFILNPTRLFMTTITTSPSLIQVLCFGCLLIVAEYVVRYVISYCVRIFSNTMNSLKKCFSLCMENGFLQGINSIDDDLRGFIKGTKQDISDSYDSIIRFFTSIYDFVLSFFRPDSGDNNGPGGGGNDLDPGNDPTSNNSAISAALLQGNAAETLLAGAQINSVPERLDLPQIPLQS